jgi:hypothetical protein
MSKSVHKSNVFTFALQVFQLCSFSTVFSPVYSGLRHTCSYVPIGNNIVQLSTHDPISIFASARIKKSVSVIGIPLILLRNFRRQLLLLRNFRRQLLYTTKDGGVFPAPLGASIRHRYTQLRGTSHAPLLLRLHSQAPGYEPSSPSSTVRYEPCSLRVRASLTLFSAKVRAMLP